MSVRTEPRDLSQQLQSTLTIPAEQMLAAATASNPAASTAVVPVAQPEMQQQINEQHLNAAREQIREGASVFRALQQRPILPPIALHLVASGESSSNLDGMLDKSADQLEQQLQHKLGLTLALLEPLIMVLMGGLVLAIVMAILMPIFEMNQLIA